MSAWKIIGFCFHWPTEWFCFLFCDVTSSMSDDVTSVNNYKTFTSSRIIKCKMFVVCSFNIIWEKDQRMLEGSVKEILTKCTYSYTLTIAEMLVVCFLKYITFQEMCTLHFFAWCAYMSTLVKKQTLGMYMFGIVSVMDLQIRSLK